MIVSLCKLANYAQTNLQNYVMQLANLHKLIIQISLCESPKNTSHTISYQKCPDLTI